MGLLCCCFGRVFQWERSCLFLHSFTKLRAKALGIPRADSGSTKLAVDAFLAKVFLLLPMSLCIGTKVLVMEDFLTSVIPFDIFSHA